MQRSSSGKNLLQFQIRSVRLRERLSMADESGRPIVKEKADLKRSSSCRSASDCERKVAIGGSSPCPSLPHNSSTAKHDLLAVAQKLAGQNLPVSRPDVWAVVTAISEKARRRHQGSHIFLNSDEHVLGRTVKEVACQIESPNVSARHCRIFRKKVKVQGNNNFIDSDICLKDVWHVYIKDSSSNGTFINWQKLKRDSPEVRLRHGDIISLVNVPEHENAFAFVFREMATNIVASPMHQLGGGSATSLKRKIYHEEDNYEAEDGKRIRGLGIGCPDGPVSLDDVRRLQRSNEELRQCLEAHVLTIEKLRAESRAATSRHDAEIMDIRQSVSATFFDQVKELQADIANKERDIEEFSTMCAQHQSVIEDLNRRLAATTQSKSEAEDMIQIQKATIAELKEQFEEERSQRRAEREKTEAGLKAAVERARLEGSEELKRQSEAAARQHKEQLETINKLEEADKENRVLVETLRSKLENLRENLVKVEKKSRMLEFKLQEEELASEAARKKMVEREQELEALRNELEIEKAARKDAWEKVSSLELEMESAIQDLALEKQRLQGARERIVLRETQLRAFHSTAEEIAALQQKQQEQLKAMLRTLEDGDDDDYDSIQNEGGSHVRLTGIYEERELIGEGKGGGSALKLETTSKAAGQGEQEQKGNKDVFITKNGQKYNGMCDNYSATAENHGKDDSLYRNGDQGWMDGETQENDDAGSAQLVDAQQFMEITNHPTTLNNDHINGEGYNGTAAEMGYTQLLDLGGIEAGRSSSVPYGKDAGETQAIASRGYEDNNLPTPLYQRLTSLTEEGYQPKKMAENERAEVEASAYGGETMQVEDDDDQGVAEWGRTELASGNRGMTMVVNDEDDQARPFDSTGQYTSLVRTECLGMQVQRNENHCAQGTMIVRESEITMKQDAPMTTLDLLTSEVAGSWAMSTPVSFHGDNGSSQSDERNEAKAVETVRGNRLDVGAIQVGTGDSEAMGKDSALHDDQALKTQLLGNVVCSQNSLSPGSMAWRNQERQVLNEMLEIVAPDFSRRHGIGGRIAPVPDTEDHTGEEEKDDCTSDSTGSEPASQSSPVSPGSVVPIGQR